MIVVTPLKTEDIQASCYGENSGTAIIAKLISGQKWTAKKSGRYWIISRKGCPVQIRMTDRALGIHFRKEEGE